MLLLLLAAPSAARDPSPPPPEVSDLFERTTTAIVLVEFWARDASGHPVAGLLPEEIRLVVDGLRRPILTLEPVLVTRAKGEATADLPAPAAGEAPASARRFVLFFNDGISLPSGMGRARQAAMEFLEKGGAPGDFFAIASSEEHRRFRLLQDFSRDRRAVMETLRRSLGETGRISSLALEMNRPAPDGAQGKKGAAGPAGDRAREWEVGHEMLAKQARSSGRSVMDGLEALVAWLAAYPGPRSILYFGDGLLGVTRRDIEDFTSAAVASSVTVHAANTRGLGGAGDDTLATIATETGGLRSNSNDAAALFRDVDAEAGGAYVVSFTPPGEADGRPHSLRLSCTRPGVQLRHRHTFVRETPDQARRRAIESAFIAPDLHARFGLDAMIPAGPEARDLLLYVPADRILFLPGPGSATARIEIGAVAFDREGHEIARMSRRIDLRRGQNEASAPRAINLRVARLVPPEAASVTAVVSDLQSGALGAARALPALEAHAGGLTGLTLDIPGETSLWLQVAATNPGSGAATHAGNNGPGSAPTTAPARRVRFSPEERPTCEIRLSDLGPEGESRLRVVVFQGRVPLLIQPLAGAEIRKEPGGVVLSLAVPLGDLAPGDYVLEVQETGASDPAELGRMPLTITPATPDDRRSLAPSRTVARQ